MTCFAEAAIYRGPRSISNPEQAGVNVAPAIDSALPPPPISRASRCLNTTSERPKDMVGDVAAPLPIGEPRAIPAPALDTFSVVSGKGYIAGLDGLRAISVALVMIAHFGFKDIVPGALGVTVFFFISGFLITTLLIGENDRTGTINIKDFYIRRFLRLAPELYPFLLITAIGGILYAKPTTWIDVASASLYFTNYVYIHYHSVTEGLGTALHWPHLWSLAVEEHFYLTYPVLIFFLRRKPRRLLAVLVGVCVAGMVWRVTAHHLGFGDSYTYVASECRMDSIAYGCIAAIAFYLYGGRLQRSQGWALILLILGGVCLLASLLVRNNEFRQGLRYTVQGLGLLGAFWGLFFCPLGQWIRGLLEFGPLRWLGRRSYALYLWHLEVLYVLYGRGLYSPDNHTFLQGVFFCVMGVAATALIAEGSFHAFLQPMQALRRRFGSHNA